MSDQRLLALYGLKFNPFLPSISAQDLWVSARTDNFFFRIETLVMDGGFAVITGESGLGKSKALHQLAERLAQIGDVVVGVMQRPQSSLSDFYRELGDLFGVNLSVANRYGGFKALRARWQSHIQSTLFRPVLLVDEAQEVATACLNELRLLGSARFDSECLLTIVLCGDSRLPERFRSRALLPLGSRVRTRLTLEAWSRDELREMLEHVLERAGAPHLMTDILQDTLVDHAAGNPRLLMTMGGELLDLGARRELAALDEKLFLEVYARATRPPKSGSQAETRSKA